MLNFIKNFFAKEEIQEEKIELNELSNWLDEKTKPIFENLSNNINQIIHEITDEKEKAFELEMNRKLDAERQQIRNKIAQEIEGINFWITLNEPCVYTSAGFLKGHWPPDKRNIFKYLHSGLIFITSSVAKESTFKAPPVTIPPPFLITSLTTFRTSFSTSLVVIAQLPDIPTHLIGFVDFGFISNIFYTKLWKFTYI